MMTNYRAAAQAFLSSIPMPASIPIPEPKNSYELNCAIAQARSKFREWNDVAGVFGQGTGSMSEILSVIDDAVEIGWKAATEETVIGYTGLSPCDPANVGGPIV